MGLDNFASKSKVILKLNDRDIKAFKKQLYEKEAKDEAMWEKLSITDPKLSLLSTINPKESEYIAQSNNTEKITLKLCPSESLVYLETLKNNSLIFNVLPKHIIKFSLDQINSGFCFLPLHFN